jgi:predicted nuclease of predicted toxin-antitoxin system
MKLLLDENLSRRLVPFLQSDYPGTTQIALLGMEQTSDREVWHFAKDHEFVIVTRDSDFYDFSTLYGQPPKVLWLRTGNQSKVSTLALLREYKPAIENALLVENKACIEIFEANVSD